MGWRWLLVYSLFLGACVDVTDEEATTSTTEPSRTTAGSPEAVLGGRLAVLDGEGNVVVMSPDGTARVALTDDGGVEALYSQPTWSPSGSGLAWGQVTEDGFGVGLSFVDGAPHEVVPMSNLPFYMFWSPDEAHIGVLHNGSNGLDFEMVDVEAADSSILGTGAPFYFSWSPKGDRVVAHIGEDRFTYIDLAGQTIVLERTAGTYLAPQWTDRGIMHVVDGNLVTELADGTRTPIAPADGPITLFAADGRGKRVAAQSLTDGGAISVGLAQTERILPNAVWVIDVDSGKVEKVSNRPALAFFWNDSGDALLMFVPSGDADQLVPIVWSMDGGAVEYTEFVPSPSLASELLPFFPQYAQSMTLWAPDSSAFVYSGEVGSQRGIWVQTVEGGDPRLVSDGGWVAWSR